MKYVLFGTGDYYKRFRHWFANREVVAILDNDVKKQGTTLDGHPVIAPECLSDYTYNAVVILSFYITEMKNQLLALGVDGQKIFHFYDLHELFQREQTDKMRDVRGRKSILLLSHDLSLGGPALALYHAALTLKKSGYEVVYASMLDGELRGRLEDSFIPVIIDERLQIGTMDELAWTEKYDLILCNTINYHNFLSARDVRLPVIWWLHDSAFFYEGIRENKLKDIDDTNLKLLSVGTVPKNAMHRYKPGAVIEDLVYGVSNGI